MPEPVNRFLLTGAPGTGKTTLVCKLARELRASTVTVGGFFTREVRAPAGRVGFEVEDFRGHRALIAHVGWTSGCRVGRYHVDVAAFERIALPAIEQALSTADVIIIDEIGRMELCSETFTRTIDAIFSAAVPLVATVHARQHPVTDMLKERPGIELLELSATNRDEILTRLVAQFRPSTEEPPHHAQKRADGEAPADDCSNTPSGDM